MSKEDENLAAFEAWWEDHGQYGRAGGGDYEKTFAYNAWQASRKNALEEALHITQHINDNCSGAPAGPDEIAEEIKELQK